ncbi:hypothetical protein E2C01_048731 [Portunus trituberculatus]|uniref:Uncharacterized protein n=1 Tax=Portunus trituberculatus TaxID=210409 RepID=A0A5B7GBV2_PORTR|nr:hypothetical protein [Portunus trituberculatus]
MHVLAMKTQRQKQKCGCSMAAASKFMNLNELYLVVSCMSACRPTTPHSLLPHPHQQIHTPNSPPMLSLPPHLEIDPSFHRDIPPLLPPLHLLFHTNPSPPQHAVALCQP